jgi:hypothetical protein
MNPDNNTGCPLCIEVLTPAGIHPVLGPVFRICPACYVPCPGCNGSAVWPADMGFFTYLVDALYALGFDVDVCRDCLGVLDIYPATTEVTR